MTSAVLSPQTMFVHTRACIHVHVCACTCAQGPGETMIQFCMASLLATLVLDDDAMALIKERNEAPIMFEACLVLLSSVMSQLKREVGKFIRKYM